MTAGCMKWAEPSKLKEVRFLRITAFKPGYGGCTLRVSGSTPCVGIAVVISVQIGVSPQIVTHFPIAQADIDSKTALV